MTTPSDIRAMQCDGCGRVIRPTDSSISTYLRTYCTAQCMKNHLWQELTR